MATALYITEEMDRVDILFVRNVLFWKENSHIFLSLQVTPALFKVATEWSVSRGKADTESASATEDVIYM